MERAAEIDFYPNAPNHEREYDLLQAIISGNVDEAIKLIDAGINVNAIQPMFASFSSAQRSPVT